MTFKIKNNLLTRYNGEDVFEGCNKLTQITYRGKTYKSVEEFEDAIFE